ncbi:MAG: coenzyme F420-0:L-glutamate ligase, partial [Actinomycetes bacterium]
MPAFSVLPVEGVPEIQPGDDLADILAQSAPALADGDIVVITSKAVSKAEGRLVSATTDEEREAVIAAETARVVSSWRTPRGTTSIVATHHGLVTAAAGVDASNTASGTLVLLPRDPDASARALRAELERRSGRRLAVVVTDTFGRPWRLGQTDVAIGAAGLRVLDDARGRRDSHGNVLQVTVAAVADEIAAAADLVKGKLTGVPAAVVRGLAHLVTDEDGPGAQALVRPLDEDQFWLGTEQAIALGREQAAAPRVSAGRDASTGPDASAG